MKTEDKETEVNETSEMCNRKSSPQSLLLLAFLCVCFPVDGSSSSISHRGRHPRSIGQFGDMIRRATQREALLYNNYGNHCGLQSGDRPVVDEVDRCCWTHDRCYIAARQGVCASHWFGPAFVRYYWSWNGTHLSCGPGNNECKAATCACDIAAATCFAKHPWNAEHKKTSIWDLLT